MTISTEELIQLLQPGTVLETHYPTRLRREIRAVVDGERVVFRAWTKTGLWGWGWCDISLIEQELQHGLLYVEEAGEFTRADYDLIKARMERKHTP